MDLVPTSVAVDLLMEHSLSEAENPLAAAVACGQTIHQPSPCSTETVSLWAAVKAAMWLGLSEDAAPDPQSLLAAADNLFRQQQRSLQL